MTIAINELVGPMEVADMTGLKLETVHQYRSRGQMPDPVVLISRTPVWTRDTINEWDEGRRTRAHTRRG